MQPNSEPQETNQSHWEYDPFAEPRTIPTGWDMSEFLKSTEPDILLYASAPKLEVKDGLN